MSTRWPLVDAVSLFLVIKLKDSGRLIVSPVAHRPSLGLMGTDSRGVVNVGGFTQGQRRYLDFHRNSVLLLAARC